MKAKNMKKLTTENVKQAQIILIGVDGTCFL